MNAQMSFGGQISENDKELPTVSNEINSYKKKKAYAASCAGRPLGPTPFESSCRNSIENNSICYAKPLKVGHRLSSVTTRLQDKMQKYMLSEISTEQLQTPN